MSANADKVRDSLLRRFTEDGVPLVFWHDPDREFVDDLNSMELPDVTVLPLAQDGEAADEGSVASFELKRRLADIQDDDRYLLYAPFEEPAPEDDWLLDIRLWATSFRADVASLYLAELGLTQPSLREHLATRKAFLASQQRRNRLRSLVIPDDDRVALDEKMLAVTLRADAYDRHALVVAALCALHNSTSDAVRLDDPPDVWTQVSKYGLEDAFWAAARHAFGYESDRPTLRDLLISLKVTDFAACLRGSIPSSWDRHRLPSVGATNAPIFMSAWRNNAQRGASHDALAAAIATALDVRGSLSRYETENVVDVFTFCDVERELLGRMRDRVVHDGDALDAKDLNQWIGRRQDGHWVTDRISATANAPRKRFAAAYRAISAATELYTLRGRYSAGFQFADAKEAYEAYTGDLYRFDQLYRQFCDHADDAPTGSLAALREGVEACYVNWFLQELASAWGPVLDGDDGLIQSWRISDVRNQQSFYERFVEKQRGTSRRHRVFVIVSDALRYEVAEELTRRINGLDRGRTKAELRSQLGVLPSYTALGMAALLPGKSITLNDAGAPLIDGKSTAGIPQRGAILASFDGMALRAQELDGLSKEAGRAKTGGKDVVYIYHNRIDSEGDQEGSEYRTFEATREAINDLLKLIPYVINSLNASYLLITADHGFIYHGVRPDDMDRSDAPKPDGAVVAKKRYVVGRDLPDHDHVLRGDLRTTAGVDGDEQFWVPRGTTRFHFSGGARYFHGGAMPQEVIVPVVEVRRVRNPADEGTEVRRVQVDVLGSTHVVTTDRHRFRFLQTEAVSDRVKPLTLRIALYEGSEAVTDVQTVTFDSVSGDVDERTQAVMLTLRRDRTYSRNTRYRLEAVDTESNMEKIGVHVTIDRAFDDDF